MRDEGQHSLATRARRALDLLDHKTRDLDDDEGVLCRVRLGLETPPGCLQSATARERTARETIGIGQKEAREQTIAAYQHLAELLLEAPPVECASNQRRLALRDFDRKHRSAERLHRNAIRHLATQFEQRPGTIRDIDELVRIAINTVGSAHAPSSARLEARMRRNADVVRVAIDRSTQAIACYLAIYPLTADACERLLSGAIERGLDLEASDITPLFDEAAGLYIGGMLGVSANGRGLLLLMLDQWVAELERDLRRAMSLPIRQRKTAGLSSSSSRSSLFRPESPFSIWTTRRTHRKAPPAERRQGRFLNLTIWLRRSILSTLDLTPEVSARANRLMKGVRCNPLIALERADLAGK